jgi:glycosyltransferase involved in cell wall biosynthesis
VRLSTPEAAETGPSVRGKGGCGRAAPADLIGDRLRSASFDAAEPAVSVVISTFQRSQFLPDVLAAIEMQTLPPGSFEVTVVDDGSGDGTWTSLVELAHRTPIAMQALRLARNAGAGTGRDVGVAESRAPVVVFTDDDCVPTPTWLSALTRPFRFSTGDEPPHLVVQGKTVPWSQDEEGAGAWARSLWVLGPTWLFETCNIAYRRTDLQQAGSFIDRRDAPSVSAARPFGEDAELGWRVMAGGAELRFEPDAVVEHRHFPAGYGDFLREIWRRQDFPDLVSRHGLARRALWRRYFLAPRTAAFDLAVVAGLAAATSRKGKLFLGVLPWIWLALPEAAHRTGRHPGVRLGQLAMGDAVSLVSLVRGSVRARTMVL